VRAQSGGLQLPAEQNPLGRDESRPEKTQGPSLALGQEVVGTQFRRGGQGRRGYFEPHPLVRAAWLRYALSRGVRRQKRGRAIAGVGFSGGSQNRGSANRR